MSTSFDNDKAKAFVVGKYDTEIVEKLSDYIRIPNQSPFYDPEFFQNSYTNDAVQLIVDWIKEQKVEGLQLEVIVEEGRTPLIFAEIPAFGGADQGDSVLLYGHLDKQPPLTEQWAEGLHPHKPVIKDGKLYGRGGADDGYSAFAAITAIKAVQEQGLPHSRCVMTIESSEESGSPDLPYYISKLTERIGDISLIVCLDSGAGNYDQLWLTSSLRGMVAGDIKVSLLKDGVHSGHGSGIVADGFRICKQLISRIEDEITGAVVEDFQVEIPEDRLEQAKETAKALGEEIWEEFPFVKDGQPVTKDPVELLLNRTWRAALSVVGVDGFPDLASAGNVLRRETAFKLSLRIPPTAKPQQCGERLKEILEKDPPYNAEVSFEVGKAGPGWNAPATAPWLEESINAGSEAYFQKPACYLGEGGSIPFMGMLGEKYPKAQFMVTGVLGPHSNAHGPNESFDINMGKGVTFCVARVLVDHYNRQR